MAVSGDEILSPRPQPLAGLRQGVPVKGPHHRLFLDEVFLLTHISWNVSIMLLNIAEEVCPERII